MKTKKKRHGCCIKPPEIGRTVGPSPAILLLVLVTINTILLNVRSI